MDDNKITREEARKLLFKREPFSENDFDERKAVFDDYGNYSFPTDITTAKPNSAYSISSTYVYGNTY